LLTFHRKVIHNLVIAKEGKTMKELRGKDRLIENGRVIIKKRYVPKLRLVTKLKSRYFMEYKISYLDLISFSAAITLSLLFGGLMIYLTPIVMRAIS